MAMEPTHGITFDAASLTEAQADGMACVVCSADYMRVDVPSIPVGTSATGSQVFACESHVEPAAEGKSSSWPEGEPATVRQAEAEAREVRDLAVRWAVLAERFRSRDELLARAMDDVARSMTDLATAVADDVPEVLDGATATARARLDASRALLAVRQAEGRS
ncbi:hypothetical protein [Actinomadura sp. 9N407]|uniref:hypothetical protein n=1 Tax=Actinomadura sp. 9N407 TaxID=3375154 RepID=UPI0037880A1F